MGTLTSDAKEADSEPEIHLLTCSSDKKLCRWSLAGKMLSNVSVGDEIPYCLMPTLPFHGASTKKKKKRAKQKKFVLVASNTITAYNVSDYESAKAVGTFQGHASRTRLLRM